MSAVARPCETRKFVSISPFVSFEVALPIFERPVVVHLTPWNVYTELAPKVEELLFHCMACDIVESTFKLRGELQQAETLIDLICGLHVVRPCKAIIP